MKPYRAIAGRAKDGNYRTSNPKRWYAADRRRELAKEGICINARAHGKATDGVRCAGCAEKHRGSR